jgi:hypothetical protein
MYVSFIKLSSNLMAFTQELPSKWKYNNELATEIFPINKNWHNLFKEYNIKSISPVWTTNVLVERSGLMIEDTSGKVHFFSVVSNDEYMREDGNSYTTGISFLYELSHWMKKHKAALVIQNDKIEWVTKTPCPKPFWKKEIAEKEQQKAINELENIIYQKFHKKLKKLNKGYDEDFESIKERFPKEMWDKVTTIEQIKNLDRELPINSIPKSSIKKIKV